MGRVEEIFDQTHHGGLKKIQLNPTHMGRVEPMDWTTFFILLLLNWAEKNISHLPPELINKIYINIWTNIPTQLYINIWNNIH